MTEHFSLDVPAGHPRRQAIAWLMLALGSLIIGGLFTILIVLSRTPAIQDIIPWVDFFHTALVVHVDLTVLVWFLAFAGVFWSINRTERCAACGWLPLILAVAGAIGISLSPFLGAGGPFMNNYVPVLRDPIFFVGLGVFGLGFTLMVVQGLFLSRPIGQTINGNGTLRFGLLTALVSALIAVMALAWTYAAIPEHAEGEYYYELLFWGAGHTIQITHTQLMLVAWLWLAAASGATVGTSPRVVVFLLALGALPAVLTPAIYMAFEVGSGNHLLAFTQIMQYGGGLGALPIGLLVFLAIMAAGRAPEEHRAVRSALFFSILLFGAGGIIGFLIDGSNVRVPAHYHGSIVGVTLAFMGVTYHILPRLGFRKPSGKMANWQPAIYGGGQLLHILALAWTGGYGVQRKTAGAAQGLKTIEQQIGMGLMGLGGLIAIIGGILFLVVAIKAMWPQKGD